MRRALALAARGRFTVAPNPKVGAVLVRDGRIVGEGFHVRAGEPHAEVHALAAAGEAARGATLYVTLEPCAHQGRTPPCVDAVIAAGVARVVATHRDPNPATAGRGFDRLRAAGIEVETGPGAADAIELNLPFLVAQVLGRPAVTLKWAASLDGRIATAGGESRWITGARARRSALELREEHDAILVGIGTVLADDPRLDAPARARRRPDPARSCSIADCAARRQPASSTSRDRSSCTLNPTTRRPRAALVARGAEVVRLAEVTPVAVLADLRGRGVPEPAGRGRRGRSRRLLRRGPLGPGRGLRRAAPAGRRRGLSGDRRRGRRAASPRRGGSPGSTSRAAARTSCLTGVNTRVFTGIVVERGRLKSPIRSRRRGAACGW